MIDEYSDFVAQFKELSEIDLSHYNRPQVLRRLTAYRQRLRLDSLADLLKVLQSDPSLLQECLARLTISVSEFFRDRELWQVLKEKVSLLARRKVPLRFWSAGCAAGEEPYSLAYLLINMLPRSCWEIVATDLSSTALAAAKEGTYWEKALKNLSDTERAQMFEPSAGGSYRIKEPFRQAVKFYRHNLLLDPYPVFFDVVLCRNVIIYFTEKAKKKVFAQIAQALAPGGLLFVGGSEQIIAPQELGLEREDIYVYRSAVTDRKAPTGHSPMLPYP